MKIISSINDNRYSTNPNGPVLLPQIEEIEAIFKLPKPFDLSLGLSHTELAKKYFRERGSRKGFKVYVYKEGVEVKGEPFSSYNQAQKVLKFKGNRTIAIYIDTNRVFNGKFTFYSHPIVEK